MEVVEEVDSGVEQIVAVRKNDEDDIIAFKTSSGRELDYITALDEAKAGKLAHNAGQRQSCLGKFRR